MKTLLIVLAFTSVAAYGDEASIKAKVEEFLVVSGIEQLSRNAPESSMDFMKQLQQTSGVNLPAAELDKMMAVQKKAASFMREAVSWEKMKPDYMRIYSEALTEKELEDSIAFYKSPSGKALIGKTPAILAKVTELTQMKMLQLFPKMMELIKEAMGTPKQ